MQQRQEVQPLTQEALHKWLNDYATKVVFEALRLTKEDLVKLVLLDSDNIQDPYLDRRINHYSGALRTLNQFLDPKELANLLEDHKLLDSREEV